MTKVFRVLSFIIAGLVVVQATSMVWAVAGLGIWVEEGNDFTSELFESDETPFTEVAGFMIHGMNGMMLIPLIALITMIIGLIAKFPGSTKYGVGLFLLVVLQVALGLFGHENAIFGALHGLNAMILFGAAIMAGMRAKDVPVVADDGRPLVDA
jgi:hypothetical protein